MYTNFIDTDRFVESVQRDYLGAAEEHRMARLSSNTGSGIPSMVRVAVVVSTLIFAGMWAMQVAAA